ncbi:2-dehydro-3-deoxygalactonokinase [Fulvimarina sp. MAC8]|uniref:2-dehydro-3-deoxygalactonokinase n=1 Tax=Fulvimarina sp. MAC8 TaxID=3162874 RepID=UPI0032F08115
MDEVSPSGPAPAKTVWVAVDWGTTNLRLWLMGTDDQVLDHRTSNRGMGSLQKDQFETVLTDLLADVLPEDGSLPVVCCGMVGARQGWVEAPYAACPCSPSGTSQAVTFEAADRRLAVNILPGVKQIDPPDVMRGEETQIAGLLADSPEFEGAVCLPGTHSKWAKIASGRIETFRTFMTGELFALMSKQSILRHSVGVDGLDEAAFSEAVSHVLRQPSALTGEFFSIRAASLLTDANPDAARARLSGLLIGAELAAARSFWEEGETVIIGESALARAYRGALDLAGGTVRTVPGDELTLAGLTAAYRNLKR